MLSLDDPRWAALKAGYRIQVELPPLLRRLESEGDPGNAWAELWNELHHQGDVGEGSFAAVPHLVRIHRRRGVADWNTYALVTTIELARAKNGNPDVPEWLKEAYDLALQQLAQTGLQELPRAGNTEAVRGILAVLAIVYGARTYARFLAQFSEEELLELEREAFGE